MVDEIQQALVGPVEVFEDEHERAIVGDALEEATPRCEGLASAVPEQLLLCDYPNQRLEVGGHPVGVVFVADTAPQLSDRVVRRVRLEDPRVGLDDLAERPE